MPPVVVAAVVASASAYAGVSLLVGAALVLSAYSIASVMSFRYPSAPSISQDITNRKITLRSANPVRKSVYGQDKVSGPLAFAGVTGDDNEFLHLVILLADHESEEIGDVYFNDQLSTWYDQFNTKMKVSLYNPTRAVVTNATASISDSAGVRNYSAGSVAGLIAALTSGETQLTVSFANNKITLEGNSIDYSFSVSGTVTTDIATYPFGSETVSKNYRPYRISKHLGSVNQVADPDLVAEVSEWTSNHRLKGITYLYVRLMWSDKVWVNGIPNISTIVKGKKLYDPRSGNTVWSDNAVLAINDFLKDSSGFNCSDSEVDESLIISEANICDEDVFLDGVGNTQKRYTLNGTISHDQTPKDILNHMVNTIAGSVVFTQGSFKVYTGSYSAPVKTLTASDLRAPIQLRASAARADLFNAVRGTFANPDKGYEPCDFPFVTNSFYESQDGERIYNDMDLPFINNATRAQRIAKIALERGRQGITVNFPAKLTAMELSPMDNVRLDIDQLGWGSVGDSNILLEDGISNLLKEDGGFLLTELSGGKQFRVTQWTLNEDGGIDLVLAEEASGIYDWNYGSETVIDLAPNSNLPNPFTVDPPSGLSASSGDEDLLIGSDGSILSRVNVSWIPPRDVFVTSYDLQWKKTTEATWSSAKVIQSQYYITGAEDGTEYDIRIRANNAVGVPSNFTSITHTIIGKSAPPPDITSFFISTQGDGTRQFSWMLNSPPPDLAGYKIKYVTGTGGVWSGMTDLHTGLLQTSPFETNQLAAGAYTFGIKAVDTSGNESSNAKIIEGTLSDPRLVGILTSFSARVSGWPGTKTNAWVSSDGDLHAKDQKTWADFALDVIDWANWTTWARSPYTSISYEHPKIDLGIKTKFIPLVTVTTSAATISIQEAHSDDDITYTSFATVTTSEIEARYIKIKVTITDVINNPPTIDEIICLISAKVVLEDIEDLDISTLTGSNRIATGHVKIPIQNSYSIIRRVDIALQNVGAGWTWELISKSDLTYGPEIKIYNGSGTLADATIDATIKGL